MYVCIYVGMYVSICKKYKISIHIHYVYVPIHTYIHTYIHILTTLLLHTYIHTYIHMYLNIARVKLNSTLSLRLDSGRYFRSKRKRPVGFSLSALTPAIRLLRLSQNIFLHVCMYVSYGYMYVCMYVCM